MKLPVVTCGRETRSITVRGEHTRIKVSEKKVLRRILGELKERRNLRDGKLQNLYPSPNTVGVIKLRMDGQVDHVAHTREIRNAYNISAGKRSKKEIIWDT
jgi:hypothetical protein